MNLIAFFLFLTVFPCVYLTEWTAVSSWQIQYQDVLRSCNMQCCCCIHQLCKYTLCGFYLWWCVSSSNSSKHPTFNRPAWYVYVYIGKFMLSAPFCYKPFQGVCPKIFGNWIFIKLVDMNMTTLSTNYIIQGEESPIISFWFACLFVVVSWGMA